MKSTETRDTEVHFKRQQGQKRKQIKKYPKILVKTTQMK